MILSFRIKRSSDARHFGLHVDFAITEAIPIMDASIEDCGEWLWEMRAISEVGCGEESEVDERSERWCSNSE